MLPLFYPVATTVMKLLLMVFCRWQVIGTENVPQRGPFIVVANHLSLVDPPLLSVCIPRKITFMAKEELFSGPGSIFIRSFGAFPVKRGSGKDAIREASRTLGKGDVLGMFPEGKRSLNHLLGQGELGAALLAIRCGVPVVPVGISGTENVKGLGFILKRPRITVTIGAPLDLGRSNRTHGRARLSEATECIMRHIAAVLPSEYHGRYGPEPLKRHTGGKHSPHDN